MVMQYWARQDARPPGEAAQVARIHAALYRRSDGGVRASDMQRYFQEHGFQVFTFVGTWDDLAKHIARGRPLVLSLGPASRVPLHYVVLTGVDNEGGYVFLNDPARQKALRISRAAFQREWQAGGNWTLLALPKS